MLWAQIGRQPARAEHIHSGMMGPAELLYCVESSREWSAREALGKYCGGDICTGCVVLCLPHLGSAGG